MIRKLFPVFGLILVTVVFFWQFLFKGLLPIPSDTIVGLYHPYRDLYAKDYPNGIPFKNFLITDPVRQQFPWRNISVNYYKNFEIPTWNPYSFSGTPLLANFQSGVFYPINLIFLMIPFEYAWTILILLQPLLASIFMYFYLKNLKLDEYSSFLGGVIFAFSGFFATWLEWGSVLNTALWLPLILLSIDKIFFYEENLKNKIYLQKYKISGIFIWSFALIISLSFSFFAGHLQTFFYLLIFAILYLGLNLFKTKNKIKCVTIFFSIFIIFAIITLPQWLTSLKFIFLSGRSEDQLIWQKEGWFIPIQHLVQFLIPDFFGNPTTLNYWGVWNYGELTGYVGIVALVFALFAVVFRRDKKTLLFLAVLISTILIAIQNPISKIPFIFNLPFISTAQPTRILFITDFALSILAALGLNYFLRNGKLKQIILPLSIAGILFISVIAILYSGVLNIDLTNILVARRNAIFPILIFTALVLIVLSYPFFKKRKYLYAILLISLVLVDLFRFSWKFNTFSNPEYLYPETQTIKYLEKNLGNYRFATSDSRVMAPNFSIIHRLNSVEGYDPLYLNRYGEFVAAVNRNKPDIKPPFGFNRIIRVENFSSNLVDLMGVKYVLSLSEMNIKGFDKVLTEGQTIVYENKEVLPRAFFVKEIKSSRNKNEVIELMFDKNYNPRVKAIVEENINIIPTEGEVKIIKYSENEIILQTRNKGQGFLVLTDSFYPSWHARINGQEQKIYITDFIYRGIIVPPGDNEVIFSNDLL